MTQKKKQERTSDDVSPSVRYQEAMEELDAILQAIEREDVDIDELSGKVERAADLVRICRERIRTTEERVQGVVKTLAKEPDSDPDGEKEPEPAE